MSIEFSAYEYLVGKDIFWNLDSKYLRSVRHKLQRMEIEGDISSFRKSLSLLWNAYNE